MAGVRHVVVVLNSSCENSHGGNFRGRTQGVDLCLELAGQQNRIDLSAPPHPCSRHSCGSHEVNTFLMRAQNDAPCDEGHGVWDLNKEIRQAQNDQVVAMGLPHGFRGPDVDHGTAVTPHGSGHTSGVDLSED